MISDGYKGYGANDVIIKLQGVTQGDSFSWASGDLIMMS